MAHFWIKRGDTYVPMNANMDLTNATAKAFLRQKHTPGAVPVEIVVTISDARIGDFRVPTASLGVGHYDLEVEVVQGDGSKTTLPTADTTHSPCARTSSRSRGKRTAPIEPSSRARWGRCFVVTG